MKRQRDDFVPIDKSSSDLGGHVKALRKGSPQSRHHFTQSDQVNQLVGASEADPDLGFMARLMALCSPAAHQPRQPAPEYKRVNGPYKLVMIAGADNNLPFGNLPRLLLALGLRPKRCEPKAANRSWVARSRSSCVTLGI